MPFSFADHPDPHVRELYELLEGGEVPEPAPEPTPTKPGPEPTKPALEANGRFTKGNKGGPGNPHARETAMLRSMALQFMDEGKFMKLLETLFELATAGSIPAIRLLLQYTLGKPLAGSDPDQVDVDEWKLHQKSSHTAKELDGLLNSLSVDYLNHLARNVWPTVVEQVTSSCAEQLRQEMAAEARQNETPSANGDFQERPPSANGPAVDRAPSANVPAAGRAPSANGEIGGQASRTPSANVPCGAGPHFGTFGGPTHSPAAPGEISPGLK